MKEVERYFRPEFINRLDDVIVFRPLTQDDLTSIVELRSRQGRASGSPQQGIHLHARPEGQGLPHREGLQPRLRRPAAAPRHRALRRGPAQRDAAAAASSSRRATSPSPAATAPTASPRITCSSTPCPHRWRRRRSRRRPVLVAAASPPSRKPFPRRLTRVNKRGPVHMDRALCVRARRTGETLNGGGGGPQTPWPAAGPAR